MASLRRDTTPLSSALLALLVSGCPALVSDPFRSDAPEDPDVGGPAGEAIGGTAGATVGPPLGGLGGSAPDALLIDDLEDGDTFILPREGRQGEWYVVNDGSPGGTQTWGVVDTDSHESTSSMHSQGWGFTSWGAGVGLYLDDPGTGKETYDASAHTGISCWMRAGMYSIREITLFVPDVYTDPAGGRCTACNDHFQAGVTVTTAWAEYRVPFSTLRQTGFGTPRFAIDETAIYGIEFRTLANQNHEFWVDDISFYD